VTILAVDGSALLHRYLPGSGRTAVARVLAGHRHWVVSAAARSEVTAAVLRLMARLGSPGGDGRAVALGHLALDWDVFWQIPVDDDCLHRASRLAVDHGLATAPALQLAGFDRLPRTTTILTADRSVAVAAETLGFGGIELLDSMRPAHGLLAPSSGGHGP
jgi:hypothetical protein